MISRHDMPFGASVEHGRTRFRLWAPSAREVEIVLTHDSTRRHALEQAGAGWFEATLDYGPGARYAYRVDGSIAVPDPASRFNPDGVHAPSEVIDPSAYRWRETAWGGRRWEEAVVYELHVGTFTPEGTFAAAQQRLDHLVELGVTAIELMPVAAFPGRRGWGYDGVLPYAPHAAYGRPDDLKQLVDAAHARGVIVVLDVVYNHFGPEGNYLHVYAPEFFNPHHQTPWGAAINFDGERNRTVRDFFIHNALYWLDEYRLDGLRLDAVHAIVDDSRPDLVDELARTVRGHIGTSRQVHLVLENDRNEARRLVRDADAPRFATAQWNDDLHHALHVIVTGERDGYYADYASDPLAAFGRALAEGFVYQGEPSPYRHGERRGEPSRSLPPTAFVSFAQNHDQAGNRAFGERIERIADERSLRAAIACMLLAPAIPMLFMGEEFAASTPFLYFADFGPELADAVTRGRREEFARFRHFSSEVAAQIPDPNAESTFDACKLDWSERDNERGASWLALYRRCLAVRHRHIVPLLPSINEAGSYSIDDGVVHAQWTLDDRRDVLTLVANFGTHPARRIAPRGQAIFTHGEVRAAGFDHHELAPTAVVLTLGPPR